MEEESVRRKFTGKEFHSMSCRFPTDIYNQINQKAHDNWRPFSAELIVILYEYFQKNKVDHICERVDEIKLLVETVNFKLGAIRK